MYNVYVTRIKNVRQHPNADRLLLGECFGNTVCVSLEYVDNQLGVYFPSDGQVSVEFAEANNLLRKKDADGNNIGGYMDPQKRNVTAIRLRGEKSDGLFLPLSSLETFGSIADLKEGDIVTTFNGQEIARKYFPTRNRSASPARGNKTRKSRVNVAPLFMEHADTEQLAYNLSAFKNNDLVEITLKMHGTSQRTGYLPVLKGYHSNYHFWQKVINSLYGKQLKPNSFAEKLLNKALNYATPVYDYDYVSGTRRTILENYEGGYYGSNSFRRAHSKMFEGKLAKGETVYYEVVGFTDTGVPIMGNGNNKKLGKEFVKQYGKETVFSYGCHPNGDENHPYTDYEADVWATSSIYVYRMTMTNPDGFVIEYDPEFMRYRCEQMGVRCVPLLWKGFIPQVEEVETDIIVENDMGGQEYLLDTAEVDAGEWIREKAEAFYDGTDPIGKTHIREGIVARIVNRPKFCAYKHKNYNFKILEGIIKESADAPDIEEAEEFKTDGE